ncbi:uncharacterized protein [Parasteatoda tepidariorum]
MYLINSILGPFIGWLGQKFGPERTTLIGCLISSIGFGATFFAEDIMVVTFFIGIVHGTGQSLSSTLISNIIQKHFNENFNTANDIYKAGSCISGFIFPPIAIYLLNEYGTSGTCLIISGILLNGLPLILLVMRTDLKLKCATLFHETRNSQEFSTKRSECTVLKDDRNLSLQSSLKKESSSSDRIEKRESFNTLEFTKESILHDTCKTSNTLEFTKESIIHDETSKTLEFTEETILPDNRQIRCSLEFIEESIFQDNGETSNSLEFTKESLLHDGTSKSLEFTEETILPDNRQASNSSAFKEESILRDNGETSNALEFVEEHISHDNSDENKQLKIYTSSSFSAKGLRDNSKQISTPTDTSKNHTIYFWRTMRIFKNSTFWCISTLITLEHFVTSIVFTTLIDYSRDKGVPSEYVIYLVTFPPLFDMLGRVSLVWIVDKGYMTYSSFVVVANSYIAITVLGMILSSNFTELLIGTLFFSYGTGALIAIIAGQMFDVLDKKDHIMGMSCKGILFAPVSFASPQLIGFFRNDLKSYNGLYYLCILFCFICCALAPIPARLTKANKLRKRIFLQKSIAA